MKKQLLILISLFHISLICTAQSRTETSTESETDAASIQEVGSTTAHPSSENKRRPFPRNLIGVYGGLGLPHGASGGLEYLHASRVWSASVELGAYGYKPENRDITREDDFHIGNFEFAGRYHPNLTSFYFAAALGGQKVSSRKAVIYNGETLRPEAQVAGIYASPRVGWFWQFTSGINFGIEAGVQIPVTTQDKTKPYTSDPAILNDPDFVRAQHDAKELANSIGKQILPHAVVRLGYAF